MAGEKVLVVEDEPLIGKMLADRLAELHVEVLRAANGIEALEIAWEKSPDLILLDVMMPKMDGFEVAKVLKENPRTSHIPIIFLTAVSNVQEKVKGLQLGAEDYITKPFHLDEVLARVGSVLKRGEMAKAQRASLETRGVRGRLQDMSLPNLIQFLELEQKDGILSLTRGAERGYLSFSKGRIANAKVGQLQGEAAVYRLLKWADGEFELEPMVGETPVAASITASNQSLIMEGMRRLDEMQRMLADLPPLGTCLKISPKLQQTLAGRRLAPDLEHFLGLFDGKRDLGQIIDESGLDDLKAVENLAKLHAKGLVEPV